MIKVGDKLQITVKVTQIIETVDGTHFVVALPKGNDYNNMKICEEHINK